ncbi:MFS transporter [Mesorhizobium sp. ZMM04-5]|uniref:MFS transporter n=1 Tax=Mesorhizobium marinum TaxID=3228790 RepID=A0ABV3R3Z9_9HYPH
MSSSPNQPDRFVKPARFELRMSLIFAAVFLPLGVHLPYFPLWLEVNGFDAEQIAVILAAPMFLRVVTTPVITAMADRAGDRANVLIAISVVSVLLSLGYFLPAGYGLVLAVSLALAVFWTPQSPLADALALSGVRRFGSSYPGMRIWGSLSFLAATFIGGMILAASSAQAVPAMILAGLLATLAAAVLSPRLGPPRRASPLSAVALQQDAPRLFNRYFLLFVAGTGIINASHGFLFGFVSIYWKAIGISDGVIGMLWAWAVVAEVVIFMLFKRLFGSVSATGVLVVAGAAAILRWVAYPLIEPLGLGVPGFFGVQTLHALSTGLLLIGLQKMIAETVPEERTGAAQGVAYFSVGVSMAVVTLLSGSLYQWYGTGGFYFMALVALAGLCLILAAAAVRRPQPQRAGPGGDTSDPR